MKLDANLSESEQYKWVAVAVGDPKYTGPAMLRHVYAGDGWLAAADGFRARRVEYAHGLPSGLIDTTEPLDKYPDFRLLFPQAPAVSLTVFAETLRGFCDTLIATLKEHGIERYADDGGAYFYSQEARPPAGGTVMFAHNPRRGVHLVGRSSEMLVGMEQGEERRMYAVEIPDAELATRSPDRWYGSRTLDAFMLRDALEGVGDGMPVALDFQESLVSPVRITFQADRYELIMPIGPPRPGSAPQVYPAKEAE